MNLGFSENGRVELLQDVGLGTEDEFHFPHGMLHVAPGNEAGQSDGLEQFVTQDFNNSGSVTGNLGFNLTEWQKSELQGLTPAGIQCLLHSWISLTKDPTQGPYCNATWDEIYCWPATLAGDTVRRSCSEVMKDDTDLDPQLTQNLIGDAYRICSEDATWLWGNWTNYNVCLEGITEIHREQREVREVVTYLLFIGSILSLLCLCAALFIFYCFKSIRCDRITLHVHLMVALAVRFLLLIIIAEPTLFPRKYHYRTVEWVCKLVLALQFYAMVASINWMFIQGHYLHSKLTTNVFDHGIPLRIYCSLGWGLPLILITIWSIVMEMFHDTLCWTGYGNTPYSWIIVGPMLFVLLANLLFLGNIMRILLTKIQLTSVGSETAQFRGSLTRKSSDACNHRPSLSTQRMHQFLANLAAYNRAVKATAVLFPLLGINNLLFFVNPGKAYEYHYLIINTVLQSTQGIFVSLLYCFMCKDVKDAFRREYGRFSARRSANSIRGQSRRGGGTSYRDKLMKRSRRFNEMSVSYSRANPTLTTASIRSEKTTVLDRAGSENPKKLETIQLLPTLTTAECESSAAQVAGAVEKVHQPVVSSNGHLQNKTDPSLHVSIPSSAQTSVDSSSKINIPITKTTVGSSNPVLQNRSPPGVNKYISHSKPVPLTLQCRETDIN